MGLFSKRPPKIPKGVAYEIWSCLSDDSCDLCKSLDGISWIPGMADIREPPLDSCECVDGRRCVGIYVMNDELGAKETMTFIRELGGKATSTQINAYEESKLRHSS